MNKLRAEVIEGFRLSPHQKYLWRLQSGNSVYRAMRSIRLEGELDTDALKIALWEVANRHGMLRTSFECLPGIDIPVQVVGASPKIAYHEVDLDESETASRGMTLEETLRRYESVPFDFDSGPIANFYLITLAADRRILLICLPAICADAWTLSNLAGEISRFYCQSVEGGEEFGEPLQYIQFSEWQNELLAGEDAEVDRAYWRRQMEPAQMKLAIPLENDSPDACESFSGQFSPQRISLKIDLDAVKRIKGLTDEADYSYQAFYLMCWQIFLWKITAQTDLVINTVFNGRSFKELYQAVGLFAKHLPVAVSLAEDTLLNKLLRSMTRTLQEAHDRQDYYSWEGVDPEIKARGTRTEWPAVFEYERRSEGHICGRLHWSILDQFVCTDIFKLKLSIIESGGDTQLQLAYDSALYSHDVIQAFAEQYAELVKSAACNPEAAVSDLNMMDVSRRRQIVDEWNHTERELPIDGLIHEMIRREGDRHGEAVAVICREHHLTFGELNRRVARLAGRLKSIGVGPETVVGVMVERSVEMIEAVVAILKAGGAYLPMDAGHPRPWLEAILEESCPVAVITDSRLAERLNGRSEEVICIDRELGDSASRGEDAPGSPIDADNLAYLIYTSGSTGKPKGVMISHGAVMNLASALRESVYGSEERKRVSLNAPLSFDASVKQLVQMCYGHTLVIVPDEIRADGEELVKYIDREQIEVLDCTPSQMKLMMEAGMAVGTLEGGTVLVGGEAIDWKLWSEMERESSRSYYNVYGPTECTVDTTVKAVGGRRPVIGKPMANVKVYVLDEKQRPAGIGEAGELYIGGMGLARGYQREPGMSAERFVPDPRGKNGGERIYRTGDIVRWTPDGDLEYVGRRDDQVKVRGYRIELGEIEAALKRYRGVKEAVVIARGDKSGDKRLAAYLVGSEASEISNKEVRGHLAGSLPEYLIPQEYVWLKEVPLTRNGKVDKKALPAPEYSESEGYSAPRTPSEEIVAGIWGDVLNVKKVSVEATFFDLGGHSLLATQVVSRLRTAFKIEIPLRALFERPTVRKLARQIEEWKGTGGGLNAPPIERVERREDLPLSYAQQRLWFLEQMEPGSGIYNIPGALVLSGDLNVAALEQTITEIFRRHEVLRTTFRSQNGRPAQLIEETRGSITLPLTDLGEVAEGREATIDHLVREEAGRVVDISKRPLLRVRLMKSSGQEHVMTFVIHHIVTDGWSTGVLVREITALYGAFSKGEASPLPELPIQYADYAFWQREWMDGEALEEGLRYWKRELNEDLPVLTLNNKRSRPEELGHKGATQTYFMQEEIKEGIQRLSRAEGATMYMALMAAFSILLHRYSGQEEMVIGTSVAGRTRAETEGLIGIFINMLPIRVDLRGIPTYREVLERVREVTVRGYAYQDVPIEMIIKEVGVERRAGETPLFQVVFGLQNPTEEKIKLPGLELRQYPFEHEAARYDLTVLIEESAAGLRTDWTYRTGLFDEAMIAGMHGHFERLLVSIIERPDTEINIIEMQTKAERERQDSAASKLEDLSARKLKGVDRKPIRLAGN
jgi:amino acid adenylation domain-containing protein